MKRKSSSKLIDNRVFWSMAVCAAISLTVLAFRIKNYEPCTTVEISVKQGPLYVGELIQFKAVTKTDNNSFQWDFGDEILPIKKGVTVNHTFSTPGRYEVLLNTENKCTAFKTVYVTEAPTVVDENLTAKIKGPLTAQVGVPAIFEDATLNAHKWEWRFGETNKVDADKPRVNYTFKTPGTKTVILVVNDHLQGELMVLVTPQALDKPQEIPRRTNTPPKIQDPVTTQERPQSQTIPGTVEEIERHETKFADVSIKQLENIVTGMVEGKTSIDNLSVYCCDNEKMRVTFDGKLISLRKLQLEMKEIKNENKIKSIKVTVEKDQIKNCITTMNISLKKKWL